MAASAQWFHTVQDAFPDSDLCNRILVEARIEPSRLPRNEDPRLPALFEKIAQYVISLKRSHAGSAVDVPQSSKKRKIDSAGASSTPHSNGSAGRALAHPTPTFTCKDVSVQIPARKKLKLQLVEDGADPHRRELWLVHPTTEKVEYTIPGSTIDQAFCLPTPESIKRQATFLIFPKPNATTPDGSPVEQVAFTMPDGPPANASGFAEAPGDDETYVTVTERELARFLRPYGRDVVLPDVTEFSSSIPQAHRKGERAYHVKAHRGSKEGYLFFLPNGIVFGFKKPLAFFPFAAIDSISYTSVLQRTFNLVIAAVDKPSGADTEVKEIEFSMLDQADFDGIDEYVKRHGLNDASMAADRRAKLYGVNKEKDAANGAGVGEDRAGAADGQGESELQRAEREMLEQQQDDDDEEEDEDFEAGESDGGSATSESEEENEDGDGGAGDD